MTEYLQENRRAVIMLVVTLCVALLGGMYLLLSGGGESDELPPVSRGATPEPAVSVEPVDQSEAVVATVVTRGTGADPFGTLTGTEEEASDPSESDKKPKSSTSTKSSSKSTSDDPATTVDTGSESTDTGSARKSDESAPAEEPVVPEPITTGEDGQDTVPVRLIEVQPEYVVVRIDGDRAKLYVSIPGPDGVTYVAPLGGGCAWMGRTDTEVRVSVCGEKVERL